MLNNYSPMDVITCLKRVHKLKLRDRYQLAEIPKKSRDVIKKLEIDIPITKNG